MRHYRDILYVCHGTNDETDGLKQALSTCRNNDATLNILVVGPELPKDFSEHKAVYEDSLINKVKADVGASLSSLNMSENDVATSINIINNKRPAISIIKHILKHGYDLLIKESEPSDKPKGFASIDMELLRKCPVPVWLSHPINQSRDSIKVAVAIDPDSEDESSDALSGRMLELARSLSDSCDGELHIVSCWDYPLESELRNNAFVKIPSEQVDQKVTEAKQHHYELLQQLINQSGIQGTQHVPQLRGKPEDVLPTYMDEHGIDILVMGTVARSGIAGFMIGNTAENIIQKLSCSVLALKPHGFESSVKAD